MDILKADEVTVECFFFALFILFADYALSKSFKDIA